MVAWGTAIARFRDHPVVGIGYGGSFDFYFTGGEGPVLVHTRPHNTFLTVLYQMGLVGIVPLGLLLVYYFQRAFRHLRGEGRNDVACVLATSFGMGMVVFGFFNLLLETPFYGSMFWMNLGVGYRLTEAGFRK
jgi:O-antigen ligase